MISWTQKLVQLNTGKNTIKTFFVSKEWKGEVIYIQRYFFLVFSFYLPNRKLTEQYIKECSIKIMANDCEGINKW